MPVEGIRPLRRRLEAVADAPKDITREWSIRTVALAKKRVARKTATTARTIRAVKVTDDQATVAAGAAAPFLEGGTRPHDIVPRRARVLRFPASGVKTTLGGRVRTGEVRRLGRGAFVYARRVRHPGTRKQPFLFNSAREVAKAIGVDRVIEKWNGAA